MVLGGVEVPDDGGVIIWGTETEDVAEVAIDPLPPRPVLPPAQDLIAPLNEAVRRIMDAMPTMPESHHEEVIEAIAERIDPYNQLVTMRFKETLDALANIWQAIRIQAELQGNSEQGTRGTLDLLREDVARILPGLTERLQALSGEVRGEMTRLDRSETILGLLEGLRDTLRQILDAMGESAERERLREGVETLERAVRKYYAAQGR